MFSVRTAILSDDSLLREGLLRIVGGEPGYTVVGQESCAVFGLALRAASPDILLVDSRMEGGLELCASLKRGGRPAVIFIAGGDDDDFAVTRLEAGARGLLAQKAPGEKLVKAQRAVHQSHDPAPPPAVPEPKGKNPPPPPRPPRPGG